MTEYIHILEHQWVQIVWYNCHYSQYCDCYFRMSNGWKFIFILSQWSKCVKKEKRLRMKRRLVVWSIILYIMMCLLNILVMHRKNNRILPKHCKNKNIAYIMKKIILGRHNLLANVIHLFFLLIVIRIHLQRLFADVYLKLSLGHKSPHAQTGFSINRL